MPTIVPVLIAISVSHLLNDTIQSLIPASYPVLQQAFHLSFTQIGFITFAFQFMASMLQPFIGYYTDKRPQPFSLAVGMACSFVGLVLLSLAQNYPMLLVSVALVGLGSAIFHPEASRVANLAAGKRRGLAQGVFQVGGNFGSSLGPLLAALVLAGRSHTQTIWFTPIALVGFVVLLQVGRWYKGHLSELKTRPKSFGELETPSRKRVIVSLAILVVLVFSKYFYMASMTSYFTFYLMGKFGVGVFEAQLRLFLFMFAVAAGTVLGGPLGDRFGRKYVIWFSILGVAPFTLALPYADSFWTAVLTVPIGLILASAFSAIVVYAQELVPGKIGTISGIFYGFSFGMGALGSVVLGMLADHTSLGFVYQLCAWLPLLGVLAAFLPRLEKKKEVKA
jgi:FSR family fosmidomycin resistance protein-like MFS transporter